MDQIQNIPESLKNRPDLLERIQVISKDYLPVNSPQELQIRDCSGLSNPVFIVSASAVRDQKYVIRFFESSAANFDMETKIF